MKKVLVDFGGIILFYIVLFFGIIAVGTRISYINSITDNTDIIAINN